MKWASWTSSVLGLWLTVAPFALGYVNVGTAIYTDVMPGAVIATFALLRALGPDMEGMADLSWVVAGGGLWVLLAPFLVGYHYCPAKDRITATGYTSHPSDLAPETS